MLLFFALAVRVITCFLCGCAAGLYFLFGILLSALFQRYVPQDLMVNVFGGNEAWCVLMAAAFMITGPATKITNLGALKIAMGWKRFALYIGFVMMFSFLCGMIVNLIL